MFWRHPCGKLSWAWPCLCSLPRPACLAWMCTAPAAGIRTACAALLFCRRPAFSFKACRCAAAAPRSYQTCCYARRLPPPTWPRVWRQRRRPTCWWASTVRTHPGGGRGQVMPRLPGSGGTPARRLCRAPVLPGAPAAMHEHALLNSIPPFAPPIHPPAGANMANSWLMRPGASTVEVMPYGWGDGPALSLSMFNGAVSLIRPPRRPGCPPADGCPACLWDQGARPAP